MHVVTCYCHSVNIVLWFQSEKRENFIYGAFYDPSSFFYNGDCMHGVTCHGTFHSTVLYVVVTCHSGLKHHVTFHSTVLYGLSLLQTDTPVGLVMFDFTLNYFTTNP